MRQKLGQHFLVNQEISQAIAAALELAAGDTILEVGPGHGELTQAIVAAIQAGDLKNVKVLAVEKDPLLVAEARQRFQEYPFVGIIEADILEFLSGPTVGPDATAHSPLPTNYKLLGNLPYYLTGHLLRIVSELEQKPALTIFMVQKEVAERLAAAPPRMNRLAASVQFWAEPKVLFYVSKNDFDPPPEVDSAVVLLRPRPRKATQEQNSAVFYETVRGVFAQPRKTVLNNVLGKNADGKEKEKVLEIFKKLSIRPDSRPQNLSLPEIIALSKKMSQLETLWFPPK